MRGLLTFPLKTKSMERSTLQWRTYLNQLSANMGNLKKNPTLVVSCISSDILNDICFISCALPRWFISFHKCDHIPWPFDIRFLIQNTVLPVLISRSFSHVLPRSIVTFDLKQPKTIVLSSFFLSWWHLRQDDKVEEWVAHHLLSLTLDFGS